MTTVKNNENNTSNAEFLRNQILAMDAHDLSNCVASLTELLDVIKAVRNNTFQPSAPGEEELEIHYTICNAIEQMEPVLSLINADNYYNVTVTSTPAVSHE